MPAVLGPVNAALLSALLTVAPIAHAAAPIHSGTPTAKPAAKPAQPLIARQYDAAWTATVKDDSRGYGVALLPAGVEIADWTSMTPPASALVVRFDTYDPPSKNIFNAERNLYERPQREIALFWGGREIVRRLCSVPLTGETGHKAALRAAFVTGGVELTVRVGETAVYDRYFLPHVLPFAAHFTSGGEAVISGTAFHKTGSLPKPSPSYRVRVLDHQVIANGKPGGAQTVALPDDPGRIGRVVCTLTLDRPPAGFDPWDRIGNIYVYSDSGERFELMRFMTPYRRGFRWDQDVTDMLPLLVGHKKIQIDCVTYGSGWLTSVDLTYYPGPPPEGRRPYKVVNLWNAVVVIGQADKSIESQMPPVTIPVDPEASGGVSVRTLVTGHGQAPNTDNAAEFISLWRKFYVGDTVFQNTLWKADNYLNPCRPQGGTWKFDRAGWGPGDIVTPWTIDITQCTTPGKPVNLRYEIEPFVNKTPDKGNPARHVVGSQVIFYKKTAK